MLAYRSESFDAEDAIWTIRAIKRDISPSFGKRWPRSKRLREYGDRLLAAAKSPEEMPNKDLATVTVRPTGNGGAKLSGCRRSSEWAIGIVSILLS